MSNSTANVLDLCGIKLINYLKKKCLTLSS